MTVREFKVANKMVGVNHPTYFIADIAANHDGDLQRAIDLIYLAAEAGADAVKFQHFRAKHIVSDYGFKALGSQQSHQAAWSKSIFEVYEDASVNWDWNSELISAASKANVHFFSTPYDLEAVDALENLGVPAYKIGSGDITWLEIIEKMAETGKPLFAATGASSMEDVDRVMAFMQNFSNPVCLMQCNTNYTGSLENFKNIQLNVLRTFAEKFPDTVLGLSDHTPGHATVLGAVVLGARAVEKHFTDDDGREGPDHGFSMTPTSWKEMVDRTRELELSLGGFEKHVMPNEIETVVLQRRSIRVKKQVNAGSVLTRDDLEILRPCPEDALPPHRIDEIVNKPLKRDIDSNDYIRIGDI